MVNKMNEQTTVKDNSILEMEEYLGKLDPKAKKNVEIVTKYDLGQDFMLRVDLKTPGTFTPNMPISAAKAEDRTSPRICVAPDLLSCFLGYAQVGYDFHDYSPRYSYDISKLPFDVCLKPNNKLVFDSEFTNEHWLVAYNRSSYRVKGEVVGKVHICEITYTLSPTGKGNDAHVKGYVEIRSGHSIRILPGKTLDSGYYEFKFERSNSKIPVVKKITKEKFDEVLSPFKHKLTLEGMTPPSWVNW